MFYQILILVALVQIIYGSLPRDNIHGVTIPSPSDSPTAANRRKRGSSRGWRIQNNSLGKGDGVDEGESHSPLYGTSDASPIQHSIEHSTEFIAQCNMPTRGGYYTMRSYKYSSPRQALEPIVMIAGDVRGKENVLVRVHDQCFTSEVFGSLRCDCKEQLQQALDMISDAANNDGELFVS